MTKENQGLVKVLRNHHKRENFVQLCQRGLDVLLILSCAVLVQAQVEGQSVARVHGVLLLRLVVTPRLFQESLQGAVAHPLKALTVVVVIAEGGFEHGAGFPHDRHIDGVFGHQALEFGFVEAHVVGDDVGRERVRVDEVSGEGLRVAELVAAGLDRQRHREVVALGKAKEEVLHGGAGRLVGLEKGHVGVLRFQPGGRVAL